MHIAWLIRPTTVHTWGCSACSLLLLWAQYRADWQQLHAAVSVEVPQQTAPAWKLSDFLFGLIVPVMDMGWWAGGGLAKCLPDPCCTARAQQQTQQLHGHSCVNMPPECVHANDKNAYAYLVLHLLQKRQLNWGFLYSLLACCQKGCCFVC
jgi:hypothetical protein